MNRILVLSFCFYIGFLPFGQAKLKNSSVLICSEVNFGGDCDRAFVGDCLSVNDKLRRRTTVREIRSLKISKDLCLRAWQYECCGGKSVDFTVDDREYLRDLKGTVNRSSGFLPRSISQCTDEFLPGPEQIEDLHLSQNESWTPTNTKEDEDADSAFYLTKNLNSPSLHWLYNFTRQSWKYIRKQYKIRPQSRKLYGIFHYGNSKRIPQIGTHVKEETHCRQIFRLNLLSEEPNYGDTYAVGGLLSKLQYYAHNEIHGRTTVYLKDNIAIPRWAWHDIFIYDLYQQLNMTDELAVHTFLARRRTVNSTRANATWFENWHYPIYKNYGGSNVLARFLNIRAGNFPHVNGTIRYFNASQALDVGTYVHFWSGAAKKNVQPLANNTFGWNSKYEDELRSARKKYAQVAKMYSN